MRGVALIPIDYFLTPIAEEIGLQIRRCLRPVATCRMSHLVELLAIAQRQRNGFLAIPFLEIRHEMRSALVGEQLILQVAIPIDAEVHRRPSESWLIGFPLAIFVLSGTTQGNLISLDISYTWYIYAPEFTTTILGIDVGSHASSGIIPIRMIEQDFARSGITQIGTVRIFLVYHEYFQSRTVGVEVAEVQGIAMSQTGGI